MFTGIVTHVAVISQAKPEAGGMRVEVPNPWQDVSLGESIAVNGCCLTAAEVGETLAFHLSAETLACTAPRWKAGVRVNLERALLPTDRLGGHFVSGHVDGLARVKTRESDVWWFDLPTEFTRYIAPKGSVTLDGVALTTNKVEKNTFSVTVIPHTLAATTLGERQVGDELNIEIDLLARYVERLKGQ